MAESSTDLGHGPRISDEEYDARSSVLHDMMAKAVTPEQAAAIARHELNLGIDHRLGRDFPQIRRELLWAADQRLYVQRSLRLLIGYYLRRLIGQSEDRALGPFGNALMKAYAEVLTEEELAAYFGLSLDE